MTKKTPIEQVLEFLNTNPVSTKQAIGEGTGLKGLPLFNALKKLTADGLMATEGEGDGVTYTLIEKPVVEGEQPNHEDDELDLGKPTKRDNSKYKFNGQEYGKGPLVRAVVTQHVTDNPKITFKALKEAFPDDLLKRFGIFQDIEGARKLSDARDRFFLKDEQVIKLKDKTVAVCNQFTAENIRPFLKAAKDLGYKIK